MNKPSRVLGLMLTIALATSLAACNKKPAALPPVPPPPTPTATPTPPPPPPPTPTPKPEPPPPPRQPTEDEIFAKKTLDDLNRERPLSDVFFDYDVADLSEATRAALQKNAEYLTRWPSTRVLIEGHADARGTNEYNLALGERRASAVRDYLVGLGIPAERLAIVSKGEEAPVCQEEGESCWSLNRRGHFEFTAK